MCLCVIFSFVRVLIMTALYADRLEFLGSLWLDLYFWFAVCSGVSFDSRHIPQVSYTFCRDKVMLVPVCSVHCMCFFIRIFFLYALLFNAVSLLGVVFIECFVAVVYIHIFILSVALVCASVVLYML